MTDLWTPSDGLLSSDPIAMAKIDHPHASPALTEAGVLLPDDDDETNLVHAAVVLAELDGDDAVCDENGSVSDDNDVMDDDAEPTEA